MNKVTIDTFLNNWEDFENLLVDVARPHLDERRKQLGNAVEIQWHFLSVSKDAHNLTLKFKGVLKDNPAFSGPFMVTIPFAEIKALATPDNGGK